MYPLPAPLTVRGFLSTPSARRATSLRGHFSTGRVISIHALREEGDWQILVTVGVPSDFYPRPPRGGRLSSGFIFLRIFRFLSTPSARRATRRWCAFRQTLENFYPRPPRGGRLVSAYSPDIAEQFLSTPSARRATAKTETKSLFSNKLYNILHEFRRALIYNGSKSYPNHAK